MPAKKTVAIVKRAGGSDDLSDSASVSSNSDDHVSPPVSQPKGGKMPPRRMGSTMSEALMPARAGPPPIEYVNQLAVDEEAILSSASERADVECFCRGLLEDLADMVQESIYASMMDRMAVPWTVQEVILELYMGMYFSVVDRDVEFPPTTTSDGRGEESLGGGVIRQENTNKTVPPVEGIAREQRALQLTQQFGSSDEYTGGPSSGSPLVGGAVSVASPTFSTAASPDAIHPTIITTSNNNKANVTTDRLPSDFFCKFEPVLFGERDPGASFDGTQGRPSWAILNPRGEDVDDWSTASTEEGTSETPRGNAKTASQQQGKKKRKDMPCGFIIGQRKVSKKGKVSRSEMDSLGGRSSPTAIRRQRTLQGTAQTYESLVSTSRQLTPQSNSLSLSASNQAQLLHSTPDDTGRLVECLRAVSNKERVELESRRIHFEKDGQLQTSDDESQQPSPSQATVGTPAQAAPSPHQVPPQTILKRINTGKPSQPGVAVVRIMSRQASTQQAPTADASPSTTSLDPLANVRRVLSGDGDDAVPLSPTSGVISRTGSTRKSTAAVLAEKRHASSSLPDMTPTSPLFEELKPSGNPFGAADRFGSQPDTLKQSPTSPSPTRGGTNQSKVTGARRLSLTAGVSSFRPTKGVRTPGKPDGSEGDSPTTTPTSVVKRLSSTAVPVPSQQEAHHPVQRPPRQRPKAATLRDPDAVSHYFYRDPLLGPQWSDVFLSVPEPPSIPPDSWSRGLLPSRRPIADELDATSLYLSSSVRGASRSGARPPGTGSGNRRSKSPGVATTSSASPIDDTARRRSSAVTPTSQSNPGSRPASRATPSTRPGSRGTNGSTADGSSDTVPADSKGPATGRPTGKKAPPKAPQQSRAPLPAEPQSVPEFDAAASSLTIDAPKNQLSLLQRLEYNDEDLQIQREEQRIKERMAALRSASEELNQQIANIKPRTPFTVDYKNAKVVVQKRPEGLRMEPVPGSICGGPTVVGGHRIATPEEADCSNRTTTSPLDQLIAEQLKLRVRAAEEKDAPKRRAQTAPSGATSPGRGEGGVGGNNGSNQVVKVLEDIEEEKRVRAELTSQLEKLDLKELKELSTTTHQEAALNATIGGMSSIGGGSPPRTRPGTALELDSAAQRRTASKKKLPPTDFFETEKRVETPMIARPLCPAGGVIARVGEVTTAAELTVPSTAPNGGRPMSRSEFNKLQQSNSTNNAEPAQATESAAYWQGELSGATRLPTKAHQQPPLPRPNSTPPTVGGTANNNSKATEVAAARGGSATPNAGAKVGLVQRLSSAVSKQAANDDSDKHAVPLGGVKGLLERARPSTTGLRSRALTPMSKQRKGIYVPPAHRIHAGEEGTSPTRAGRVATPTTIVELA